jgi:putative sigma-54 modulation protein
MNLEIVGRHVEITPAMRDFAWEKLRKLEKLLDGPLEVHLVLLSEKHRQHAELQVRSRTAVLSGAVETGDLFASIAEAVDKIERQAHKLKEKITGRRRREGTRASEAAAVLSSEVEVLEEEEGGAGAPTRIIPSERYRLKPLSPEDAVLELEGTGEDILVFRDAASYRVNVVYRRRDGHFGLVDPEF